MKYFSAAFITGLSLVVSGITSGWAAEPRKPDCADLLKSKSAFEKILDIEDAKARREHLGEETRQVSTAFGSQVPIARSFEKEGLYYQDIALWFPSLKLEAKKKLASQFIKEKKQSSTIKPVTEWLMRINKLEAYISPMNSAAWRASSPDQRLKYLLTLEDPFSVLSVKHRATLFEDEILNFDDVQVGPYAPEKIIVGDDLGSYEVRMDGGVIDRNQFLRLRDQTETFLEGPIGHQHFFHAWPADARVRAEIAPYYIELLDSTTWYLFWRQMKRDTKKIEQSILTHPYLGVYTRHSLERLHAAVVDGDLKKFKNKYRMMGARSFAASEDIPEQGEDLVPDWELRSGNKGVKRDFIENMLEARLSSGDYSGLNDFRKTNFDSSISIQAALAPHLSAAQIEAVKQFEELHPAMSYSAHPLAHNSVRNRIVSPLLPWQDRLPMVLKEDLLKEEQEKYAKGLLKIARHYIKKAEEKELTPGELSLLRSESVKKLEDLIYEFARNVRLDQDFERYLQPAPQWVPELTVESRGPVDVNAVPIGIEYSYRFPQEVKPASKAQAISHLETFANSIKESFGSEEPLQSQGGDSHGHGLVVRYKVTDSNGEIWRVEWDGISRSYVDGKISRAWGGHAEVPTPKFSPQSVDEGIRQVFQAARAVGMVPRRSAGGGHFNVDLEMLMEKYSPEFGARAIANLISYFESNQELILFLWMNPLRKHAAQPVDLQDDFAEKITNFKGDWSDLGRLLYEARYFNTSVGRKPKYVPLNVTAIMTPLLPEEYVAKSLDIRRVRRGEVEWFPSFGNVTGRIEARLFDAPVDEYMAALQIKYFRALMNKTMNAQKPIALKKKFSAADYERWKENPAAWLQDAEAHLLELGLVPAEFRGLLWDSYRHRLRHNERPQSYPKYDNFLPLRSQGGKISWLKRESEQFIKFAA